MNNEKFNSHLPMVNVLPNEMEKLLANLSNLGANEILYRTISRDFLYEQQRYRLACNFDGDIICPFITTSVEDNSGKIYERVNSPQISLNPRMISRLNLIFTRNYSDIVIEPSCRTRYGFEGKGLMTGLVLSTLPLIDFAKLIYPKYFDGYGMIIKIEDIAKAQDPSKNHQGYSSFLAEQMGFKYNGFNLWTKRIR